MQKNWKNWCRLCSNCDDEHVDFDYTFTNSENLIKISDTLQNFIQTLITNSSSNLDYPSKICKNCLHEMEYFDKFITNTLKSNAMFFEIVTMTNNSGSPDEDVLPAIRNKFLGTFKFQSFDDEINDSEFVNETTNENKIDEAVLEPITCLTLFNEVLSDDMDNDKNVEQSNHHRRTKTKLRVKDLKCKGDTTISKPQKIKIYRCKSCEKTFNNIQDYNQHIDSKNCVVGVFTCTQCTKTFTSLKNLKIHSHVHSSIHVPKEKRTHPCDYCGKIFDGTSNLKVHVRAVHTNEKRFVCEECGKAFTVKAGLEEHKVIHSDESPFACSYCPLKLKSYVRLKVHEDTHSDTKYVCPQCGLKLNTKQGLRGHMVCHSDEKKYKCHLCGNSYKRKKTLNIHMVSHTDQRPFICPYCGNSFTSSSHCRTHQKKNHPEEFKATFGRPQSETMTRATLVE